LKVCHENLIPLLEHTSASISEREDLTAYVRIAPLSASYHLHQCTLSSIDANENGRYSVAMALLRQCVEALTIIEVGLQSSEFATSVLDAWLKDKLTPGQIRKKLETEVWSKYEFGLWEESWSEYFGNLARAVQPYAHYSHKLMGWQFTTPAIIPTPEPGEDTVFYAGIGLDNKDFLKGARISLFITLVGWTVARLLEENGVLCPMRGEKLKEWGESIGASEILDGEISSWSDIFLPHLWFDSADFQL
jgi:hypothetical protein